MSDFKVAICSLKQSYMGSSDFSLIKLKKKFFYSLTCNICFIHTLGCVHWLVIIKLELYQYCLCNCIKFGVVKKIKKRNAIFCLTSFINYDWWKGSNWTEIVFQYSQSSLTFNLRIWNIFYYSSKYLVSRSCLVRNLESFEAWLSSTHSHGDSLCRGKLEYVVNTSIKMTFWQYSISFLPCLPMLFTDYCLEPFLSQLIMNCFPCWLISDLQNNFSCILIGFHHSVALCYFVEW